MIRFASPDIGIKEYEATTSVLKSGWLTGGPKVTEFEDKIKSFCGVDRAVCYDSCTASMEMSLRVLGIGEGDEVITTPYTYTATAEVIRNVGAKIIFCDLQADSFEMDYSLLSELITEKTKAVIPVDIGGVPCNYGKLLGAISSKASLYHPITPLQKSIGRIAVIADAAHSFGASYGTFKVGELADFTCFSFHVLKSITTGGEGGAVVWNNFERIDNSRIEKTLRLLGDHGQSEKGTSKEPGREWEYDISLFGYNHIMTDVDAAIGIVQLDRFGEIMETRKTLTEMYYKYLPCCVKPCLQHFSDKYASSMHLFPIRIENVEENERNRIFRNLLEQGVSCNVHYKPLPMFTAYIRAGFDILNYPMAYEAYKNLITLPYHKEMTEDDIKYVCNALERSVTLDDRTV